ncbi:MAG: ACT domain-containing protein [Candidatus Methylomirabilales bacterium]
MPHVTQLVLDLENQPGTLARVARALGQKGVNIEGLCAPQTAGRGKIRLLVSNLEQGESALKAAGIVTAREEAIALAMENRPGALAEAAERLAEAGVNIECAYATAEGTRQVAVILTVSDRAEADAALGKVGRG